MRHARRSKAPAAALTKISNAADRCATPKITASATAPAAAASVKSQVGRRRCREIAAIVSASAQPAQAARREVVDRPHGRGHAIHVHAGGFGRHSDISPPSASSA